MRVRCPRGSWLGMTTSGSNTAAVFGRKRLTHARSASASSFAPHAGLHQVTQAQQVQAKALAAPQLSLFASLATLATAAASAPPTTTTASARNSPYQHHHHQPYHPYLKPSTSDNNNSSSEETEEDERADFNAEFNFPQQQQHPKPHKSERKPPQFHPQHHHRLITPTRRVTGVHTSGNNMPRRKETKKIQIDVPSSEACSGIVGDPHQVFKCNGSPIISPRSIRNSLAETDFDMDGNPRPQKIANTTSATAGSTIGGSSNGGTTSDSSSTSSSQTAVVVFGPVVPPPDVASPATSTSSNGKKSSRRRTLRQQQLLTKSQQQPQEDGGPPTEVDLLALKVEEQSLSGMSGVQLWVHRLLYTHHQTLHMLGIERGGFPNTKLSLKQLECMLSPVISLANLMTPDHFGIHVPTPQVAQTMSDVHYWKLWESDTIDIGYVVVGQLCRWWHEW